MLTVDKLRHIVCGEDYVINDRLRVHNPTIREVYEYGEERYLQDLTALTIRAFDAAVFLYDLGKDFREVENYTVFLMTAPHMMSGESPLLPGIDMSSMRLGVNPSTGDPLLYNGDVVIDKLVYNKIVGAVRDMHFIAEKPEVNPGSKYAVKMWVKRQRERAERDAKRNKQFRSLYADIVSSLVNVPGCNYTYESIKDMHISQLLDSFYRTTKLQNYEHVMHGIYSGCVDQKKLGKSVFDWFGEIDVNKREIDESKIVEV